MNAIVRAAMRLLEQLIDAFEERTGLITMMGDLARHPVPPDTGWWYVFGSATLVAFMIQVVTGIALSTSYISSTGDAYQALQFITTRRSSETCCAGCITSAPPRWSCWSGFIWRRSSSMGCYKYPREFNWVTGVVLLFLTHRDGIHRAASALGSERGVVDRGCERSRPGGCR